MLCESGVCDLHRKNIALRRRYSVEGTLVSATRGRRAVVVCLGIALVAMLASKGGRAQPGPVVGQDVIPLQIAVGTAGAIVVPLVSLAVGGLVCLREDAEVCLQNPVKRGLLLAPALLVLAGPAVGASAGVIYVGRSVGVNGNIALTFLGAMVGEGIGFLTASSVLGRYVKEREVVEEVLGLEITASSTAMVILLVAPAVGATLGYHLQPKLPSTEPSKGRAEAKTDVAVTGVCDFTLRVFTLRF